ncbi:MAG TPA: hypothetical protein VJU54_11440, partial [Nitrospiraceae bacterium]|nr:hypothetical protein [Nitrospiraceae bacterium]
MIVAGPHRSRIQREAHVQGWLVSVLLHGIVALAAVLLVKQVQPTPQDEAFKWNVVMASPAQPVQPTVSPENQDPAPFAPSTTSTPSPHVQQTASPQPLPSPQPVAQQVTPSASERLITPVLTEPPTPPPLQPTTHSQPAAHTIQPSEPIRHETVTPIVSEVTSNLKP